MTHRSVLVAAFLASIVAGCGDDEKHEPTACTPGDPATCDDGFVCEEVVDAEPACFTPVHVEGRVLDSQDGEGIEGARVTAHDANGFALTTVSITDDLGAYSLTVPSLRNADGTTVSDPVTVRASAAGYLPFPAPPRVAIPIDLAAGASDGEGRYVVANVGTDIVLVALEAPIAGVIEGTVDHPAPGGALVVAEQAGHAVSTTIADTEGEFVLFNVPPGETRVAAYRAGLNVAPMTVDVADELISDVVLAATSDGLATVSGSVSLVNAPNTEFTSVILVPESTFDEVAIRGEAPAGLRAGEVTGAWSIAGVAPGRYAVLAAFENDAAVRDPDEGISGTDIVRIEVVAGGGDVNIAEGFKVTDALPTVSPGAAGLEVVAPADPLTLSWGDDSSEDGYEVRVFDAFGNMVLEDTAVERVTGSETVTYSWAAHGLEPGMVYQFRAWSYRDPSGGGRNYISLTEDLRGVFMYGSVP